MTPIDEKENIRKVSIIIPSFNEEKHITDCLDSLFSLNYSREKFEVIVVDNAFTDRTRELAEQYDVTLLRDDHKNVAGLRNLGTQHAEGDVLAFIFENSRSGN